MPLSAILQIEGEVADFFHYWQDSIRRQSAIGEVKR